jgi:dephospho-CoA kinase
MATLSTMGTPTECSLDILRFPKKFTDRSKVLKRINEKGFKTQKNKPFFFRKQRPFRIALTGGMGAGKSLVLKFLKDKGVPVFQTDIIAHQLLNDKKFSKSVSKYFGKEILNEHGRIDRKKLALEAFRNSKRQKKLNAMLHPAVRTKVAEWVENWSKKSFVPALVVVEVPLLFEGGYYRWFDGILCVSASKAIRQKRLLKRGWNLAEIQRREKLQWSQIQKNKMANWVVFNEGTQKNLRYTVHRWLERLTEICGLIISAPKNRF